MAKITLFGLAGTGTSSVGKNLAEKLKYNFYSNGDFMRDQAKELGLSIYEFDQLCRNDSSHDIARDKMIEEFARKSDNFIVDGRLAWRFIPDSFKIKLQCDFEERIARVASRDSMDIKDVREATILREQAIADRFLRYYGIKDPSNDSHFDFIVNTSGTALEEVVKKVLDKVYSVINNSIS